MAKDLPYSGTVTGEGQEQLGFSWGRNTSRAQRSRTYSISGTSGKNSLVVTQNAVALSITSSSSTTKSMSVPSSSTSWTVSGTANGRYMKYAVSGGVSVSSAREMSGSVGHSFSTSYTAVSNFIGGTQQYTYSVTISIPANISVGNYTVTVYTSDSTNGSYETVQYKLSVSATPSQDVSVTGVTVSPDDATIAVGDTKKYTATVTPLNATIDSIVWFVNEYVTKQVDGLTCTVTGASQGRSIVRCTVTDTTSHSESGYTYVNVFRAGSMSVDNVTALSMSTSVSSVLTVTDMDVSRGFTLGGSNVPEWVFLSNSNSYVDTSSSPYYVRLVISSNNGQSSRTGTVRVFGYDNLGIQRYCDLTITQEANSVIPVYGINVNGPSVVKNNDNIARYLVTYNPTNTTRRGCTWSVSGSGAQYVSIVESSLDEERYLSILEGASGQTVTLTATSTYNNQITGSIDVVVTHVYSSGNITVSDSHLEVAHSDTFLDNTNGAPTVSTQNITQNSLSVGTITGFVTNATLFEYNGNTYLNLTFPTNSDTTSNRTASIELFALDLNQERVTAIVEVTQAKAPVSQNSISVNSFTITEGARLQLDMEVTYYNNSALQTTFYQPSWVLYAAESQGGSFTQILSQTPGSIQDKTVAANTNETAQYNYSTHTALGMYSWFKLVFSTQAPQLSAELEGDGGIL